MGKLKAALRALRPGRPYHAQWFVTRKCNYRCKSCDVWLEKGGEELGTDEVLEGLKELEKLGVIELVITGGNPLLREDIGEILREASRRFITTIYDNGSLAAEKVDELRYADFVAISLDSLRPELNDYIKGVRGAWEKAVEAVRTLSSEGIRVVLSTMISQLNLAEIADFTRYWASRGVPTLYCLYYYDPSGDKLFGIGREVDELLIRDRQLAVKALSEIEKMKEEGCPFIWVPLRTIRAVRKLFETGERTWTCKALSNFLMIDQLGRISGCHCKPPVTTVFEVNDVWDSPRLEKLRRRYNMCRDCVYLCYIFYSQFSTPADLMVLAKEMLPSYIATARKAYVPLVQV